MLNLNLETAIFIKNKDGTFTVYQPIGKTNFLKIPKASIKIEAEALVDQRTGDFWQLIECEKPSKISTLLGAIKLRPRRWR